MSEQEHRHKVLRQVALTERPKTIADLGLLISEIWKITFIFYKKVSYNSAIQHPKSNIKIPLIF